MNRKLFAVLTLLALLIGLSSAVLVNRASSLGAASFPDVREGDWYYDAVMTLSSLGIINGMPDGTFDPDGTLTKGQFLTLLTCSLYYYAVPEESDGYMILRDGKKEIENWAEPYYYASVNVGVVKKGEIDVPDGLDEPIDRFTVARYMIITSEKVLGEKPVDTEKAAALLKDTIPNELRYSVAQAYGKGYVGGYEDGTFRGGNTLTRAEAATVIYRLIFPEKRIDSGIPDPTSPAYVPPESTEPDIAPEPEPVKEIIDDEWFSDAVFIGDSLTDGLRQYSGLKTPDYLCSIGASIQNLMARSPSYLKGKTVRQAFESGQYKKVFIMIGINQASEASDTFLELYKGLIDYILEKQPGARIYVQSILPVTRSKDAQGTYTIANVTRLNEVLRGMCRNYGYAYIDLYSEFADGDGFMPSDLSWDGLHLNPETYRQWSEMLTEILQETH